MLVILRGAAGFKVDFGVRVVLEVGSGFEFQGWK